MSISFGNIIYHTPFQVELAFNVGIETELSVGFDVLYANHSRDHVVGVCM